MDKLPSHLKRYIVTQDYERYTPVDHAVWRYILRQLRDFLGEHAHSCYLDGLSKTGISIDRIPRIEDISRHIERFGWRALPVSGFIPPAAFMELQSYGFLPIASDMRTLDHLSYTPAPDIVHEAAGHAPILVDPDFAAYLKSYAQVARRAIISKQDMDQYEAIRVLSDMKEHPDSTADDVRAAESRLNSITSNIKLISEAARLGRMNWWTAEYGLIGSIDRPRIFGAGLLSSVGEARGCLRPEVKKIPLTVDCIEYAYDITEPQPQLFVTPDFARLREVLEEYADTMAFRTGGLSGAKKAIESETVNTVELDSGLQIGGKLVTLIPADRGSQPESQRIAYLQFQGPTQMALEESEIAGHGAKVHSDGFGTPIGYLKAAPGRALHEMDDSELFELGIKRGQRTRLEFESGVRVEGEVTGWIRAPKGHLLLLSFRDCTVRLNERVLFSPDWGMFDMAIGTRVTSVFGGPADREAYGALDDFAAKRVPAKPFDSKSLQRFALFNEMRSLRETTMSSSQIRERLSQLVRKAEIEQPNEWLLKLEAFEIATREGASELMAQIRGMLESAANRQPSLRSTIEDGVRLAAVP